MEATTAAAFGIVILWKVLRAIFAQRRRNRGVRIEPTHSNEGNWVHFTDDNRFYDQNGSHYVHGRDEHRYYDQNGSHYYHDRD